MTGLTDLAMLTPVHGRLQQTQPPAHHPPSASYLTVKKNGKAAAALQHNSGKRPPAEISLSMAVHAPGGFTQDVALRQRRPLDHQARKDRELAAQPASTTLGRPSAAARVRPRCHFTCASMGGLVERYAAGMNRPASGPAEPPPVPSAEQLAEWRALVERIRQGDQSEVSSWDEVAAELGL